MVGDFSHSMTPRFSASIRRFCWIQNNPFSFFSCGEFVGFRWGGIETTYVAPTNQLTAIVVEHGGRVCCDDLSLLLLKTARVGDWKSTEALTWGWVRDEVCTCLSSTANCQSWGGG